MKKRSAEKGAKNVVTEIAVTTHIDSNGIRITKNALQKASKSYKTSTYAQSGGLEHDMSLPPWGKVVSQRVRKLNDGEYGLEIKIAPYEEYSRLRILGHDCIEYKCFSDSRPLMLSKRIYVSTTSISYDPANFSNQEDMVNFIKELSESNEIETGTLIVRRSAIPDPEIVINISHSTVLGLLAVSLVKSALQKATEKLSDKIGEDLVEFYSFVKKLILTAPKYLNPKNRPITYIFKVAMKPNVEFIIVTTKKNAPNDILTMLKEKIPERIMDAKKIKKELNVNHVQFLMNDDLDLELNYMTLEDGTVIGTKKSYDRRAKVLDLIEEKINHT